MSLLPTSISTQSLTHSKTCSWSATTTSTWSDHPSAPDTSSKSQQYNQVRSVQMSTSCTLLDIIIDDITDFQSVLTKHIEQDDRKQIEGNAASNSKRSCATNFQFDRTLLSSNSNGKICIMSSKGWSSGHHEWTLQVLQSDVDLQEIGVVSANPSDLNDTCISGKGLMSTAKMKARALYGCNSGLNKLWYGSWNDDNSSRCFRDLTKEHRSFSKLFNGSRKDLNSSSSYSKLTTETTNQGVGWASGDVIRVVLNLNKWRIKFYLNGKSVCFMKSSVIFPF